MVDHNPFSPSSRPEHQNDCLARAADIEAGTKLALAFADELGVAASDHVNRDAIVATVIAAMRRGYSAREDLLNLARLSMIDGSGH